MNISDMLMVVAVATCLITAYCIGKVNGIKEVIKVIKVEDEHREEFEKMVIDFITQKYERRK